MPFLTYIIYNMFKVHVVWSLKREEEKGIVEEKGKYPYFASLFKIGQKKSPKVTKNREEFQKM